MAKIVNKLKFNELIKKEELLIVDFFAPWCGPCQMFLPVFDEYSKKNPNVNMIKIDIDQETELASENSVMGVPTIIVFKNGDELGRFSGFKPLDELEKFIDSLK